MVDHPAGFFQGTEMPTAGWWEALWPDPAGVLAAVGLRPSMAVIDLCAGDGWFTLQIAKVARYVSAIDIDSNLLEVARHRLLESGVTNCKFIAGDAYDIAQLTAPADFVFMANAFHGVGQMHMDKTELFTDGEAYERMMGRWSRLVGETFLAWLDLPKGLRWLDVGCGNGAFTEEIIARCAPATVMAVDPSGDQLAYARTRPGAKTAEFRVGDAQKLPFGDGSFDVAIMALVISFLPEPDKAVAEMTRVVQPAGWVATYMWDIPGGGATVDPIYIALESMGMTTSVRPPNPAVSRRQAMEDLWKNAGLESVDTQVIRIPVVYSSFDDFWDANTVPVGQQGKLIESMSMSARAQLRARLHEHLPFASDGRIVYESFANAVKGRVPR